MRVVMKQHKWAWIAVLSIVLAPVAAGQDWPQWRGPNRDGQVTSFREPASWPSQLIARWKVDVGPGYATPLLVGDRIYMFTRQGEDEVMTALDMSSAKVIWRSSYAAPFRMNPATSRHGPGPKSTPTFANNRLFTLGMTGVVTAFDFRDTVIETGRGNGITAFRVVQRGNDWTTENVWHTDEVSVHMSDAVAINEVLFGLWHLNSGQYFALDLSTGQVLWKSDPRQAEHAAIVRAGNTIFSLEDDGELVILRYSRTRFEPIGRYDVATSETWSQPLISGNRVFVKDVSSLALWTID